MALASGDILRVAVNFLLGNGVQYQNVYQYVVNGIGGFSDAAATTAINTKMINQYAGLVASVKDDVVEQLSFVDQIEWDVTEGKWLVTHNVGTFTPSFAPSSAADVLPNQVSPFIVFKTTRPRTVGRKFLFPVLETEQDAGIIAGGMVTKLIAFGASVLADIVVDGSNVLQAGVARAGVNQWLTFQVAVVTDLLGTQRRRRPGYGA